MSRRWFRSKARQIRATDVIDAIPVQGPPPSGQGDGGSFGLTYVTVVHVEYTEGDPELYVLPLSAAPAGQDGQEPPVYASLARLKTTQGELVLFDAFIDPGFARALLHGLDRRR